VRAWTAVACDSPLIHGGRPPKIGNRYSHAITPDRATPSGSSSFSSAAPRAMSAGSLLANSAFAFPHVPFICSCSPMPR
jgi:hypothetical protein